MNKDDRTRQLCLLTVRQALDALPRARRSSQWLTFFWPMSRMDPQAAISLMILVAIGPGLLLGFATGMNVAAAVVLTFIPMAVGWAAYAFGHYEDTPPSEEAARDLVKYVDDVNKRLDDMQRLGVSCRFLHFQTTDQIEADLADLERQLLAAPRPPAEPPAGRPAPFPGALENGGDSPDAAATRTAQTASRVIRARRPPPARFDRQSRADLAPCHLSSLGAKWSYAKNHCRVLCQDGQRKLWFLTIAADLRLEFEPLAVEVPEALFDIDFTDKHVVWPQEDDWLVLKELAFGTHVKQDGIAYHGGFCFSPQGRLIVVEEERSLTFVPEHSDPLPLVNTAFNRAPADPDFGLMNPKSIAAVNAPDDDLAFYLALGCYGYVVVWKVSDDDSSDWGYLPIGPPKVINSGLVTDPTSLTACAYGSHVFVTHGYGTGVARIALGSGQVDHAPAPVGGSEHGYFGHVVPSWCGSAAALRTKRGVKYWRIGMGYVDLPEWTFPPLAHAPGLLLCRSEADPSRLVWFEP